MLWSLFQPTSFQWERSRHSSVSDLQDQKSIEMSFFNLNEEAFFVKKKKNYPELRKLWSLEVG